MPTTQCTKGKISCKTPAKKALAHRFGGQHCEVGPCDVIGALPQWSLVLLRRAGSRSGHDCIPDARRERVIVSANMHDAAVSMCFI